MIYACVGIAQYGIFTDATDIGPLTDQTATHGMPVAGAHPVPCGGRLLHFALLQRPVPSDP